MLKKVLLPGGAMLLGIAMTGTLYSETETRSDALFADGNQTSFGHSGELYWTTVFGDSIERSSIRCPAQSTVIAAPSITVDIALDEIARKMYWTAEQPDQIFRANLDGSQLELLYGDDLDSPFYGLNAIELDLKAGKMYWTESGTQQQFAALRRANLDGSSVEDVIPNALLRRPSGLAIHFGQRKLYWGESTQDGEPGRIRRANMDGSNIENLIEVGVNTFGLALDERGSKMYWTNNNEGEVWRANLDGSEPELLAGGLDNPLGIVLDVEDSKVYWADHHAGLIYRANLNGTNTEVFLATTPHQVEGIALKRTHCFGDLDNDGEVGPSDFFTLIDAFGECAECPEDLNCNGSVGLIDLLYLIFSWGPCD
jgi:hypothetical protein